MAGKETTFNLSIKGDLSDLKKKLETLPDITKTEARKMVTELDRQIKQTQKATEKQAKAIQQASKQASKHAKSSAGDVEKLSQSLDSVGEKSGDIDRGFSGIGLALREVNPQLAEASDGLADSFAVVESLTMGFGKLNPMVLAGSLAIGALTLGYQAHKAELERVRVLTLELRDAQKQLNDSQKAHQENLEDGAGKLRELRNEYALMTGNMTEFDHQMETAGQGAFDQFRGNIKNQETIIQQRKQELDLVRRLYDSSIDMGKSEVVLSDEQRERLRVIQLQTKSVDNQLDLTQRGIKEAGALARLEKTIQSDIAEQEQGLQALELMRTEAVDLAQQMVEFEREISSVTEGVATNEERSAQAKERALRAEEERLRLVREALDLGDYEIDKYNAKLDLERTLFSLKATGLESEVIKIDEKYKKEIDNILKLSDASGETALAQEAVDELNKQKQEEITQLRIDNQKKIRDEEMKTNQMMMSSMGDMYNAVGEMVLSFHANNKEASREAFMINKIVSAGSVSMKMAEAIMMAQTLPPPVNGIQTAVALATGASQLANVMSQQPSFHMGGLVPDETMVRALKGEMILSKQTVKEMGGEQGVKSMARGKSQDQPQRFVVDFPYKNLGRYSRAIGQKKVRRTGIRGY